ncbi:toprim domain-containing protein [Metabacillus fastidiosus]|uniref:toprim domain-containing protein n=1 Tax=Metabacillus fastidiosus TaxID=1458 RepID=UPI003D2E4002
MTNIQTLSEKEKVRKRISVWLGSNTHSAVIHCIRELIGNSIDQAKKDYGDKIKITKHNCKKITFEDNCCGLPIEGKNDEGIDNWYLLFNRLFAGTKYQNGIMNNDYDIGVNGVFLTVLTFSSKRVQYEIARPDGNIYYMEFFKGDPVDDLKIIGKSDKTYSKITYELDDEVYEQNYYTSDEIQEIAEEQASLFNGKIIIEDLEKNEAKEFKFNNGIQEYLKSKTSNLISDQIYFSKNKKYEIKKEIEGERNVKIDDIEIDIAMSYSKDIDNITQIEFLNRSNLKDHGSIQEGFINGLRSIVNKKINELKLYKNKEKQINKEDVSTGLNYIIDFKSYFPIFANQTKLACDVEYYKDVMKNVIEREMEVYFIENKESLKILNFILTNKRAREKSEQVRNTAIKDLSKEVKNSISRPEKFVPCRVMSKDVSELIVIEGDSALNSVKSSRNSKIQCIFPLKGKSVNALKNNIDDVIKNQEVIDLFRILNCGMEFKGKAIKNIKKFNIDDLSVNKIIIFSDADDDGGHIITLVISILYVLAPKIIENGHLYVLESPLYRIETKNDLYLAYDDKEKNGIVRDLDQKGIKFTIQRFKGLGGLNASVLSKTAMSPENRRLTRVTLNDVEKSKKIIELFLDEEVSGRKAFIEEHGDKYFDFSIYE